MGQSKGGGGQTVVQSGSGSSTPQATEEEKRLQQLELQRREALQDQLMNIDKQTLSTIEPLTRGDYAGGIYSDVGKGISQGSQDRIVQQSLNQIAPRFQQQGLLDSGTRMSMESRLAGDIGVQAELQKQRDLVNLLGFMVGAPAQAQQPVLNETALLSQRLSGLRPTNSTFSQTSNTPGIGGGRGWFSLF